MIVGPGYGEPTGRPPARDSRTGSQVAARYWELRWHDEAGDHALRFSLREVADSYDATLRRTGLSPTLARHTELDLCGSGTR